jgi:hypothetical protein
MWSMRGRRKIASAVGRGEDSRAGCWGVEVGGGGAGTIFGTSGVGGLRSQFNGQRLGRGFFRAGDIGGSRSL